MSTIKFKDFNSCCRGCLEFHGPFTPLFGAYLNDIFANVTSVVVDPNDNYPQQICSKCIVKVNMAFTFKQMVLNKHKILTEVINSMKTCENINEIKDSKEDTLINAAIQTSTVAEQLNENNALEVKMSEDEVKMSGDKNSEELSQTLVYDTYLKCSHCTSTFCTRTELQVHLKTHREVCIICQKLVSAAHKPRHMRAHKKKKKCMVCDKVFADPTNLTLHIKRHYGYNTKDELCAVCGKKFQLRTSLHKHMRQHKQI